MVAPFQSHIIALESPTLATNKVLLCTKRMAIKAVLPEMSRFFRNCSTNLSSILVTTSLIISFIVSVVIVSKRFDRAGQVFGLIADDTNELLLAVFAVIEHSALGTLVTVSILQFSLFDPLRWSLIRFTMPSNISFSACNAAFFINKIEITI